jgi:hypothetical protein
MILGNRSTTGGSSQRAVRGALRAPRQTRLGCAKSRCTLQCITHAEPVTVRLLAGRPTPEGARPAALVLDACPPERSAGLHLRARAALGPAPAAEEMTGPGPVPAVSKPT